MPRSALPQNPERTGVPPAPRHGPGVPARWPWLAALLAALALGLLYRGPLATGFLSDDYVFLEAARLDPLPGSLLGLGAIGNYYRPLSRQLWFGLLAPIAGASPAVFHAANALLFAAALALLFDLLLALVPAGAALAGALYFALLPLQRVNLTWVSCVQDLLALLLVLAAVALYRRGRLAAAWAAALAATAAKEIALALPIALTAWSVAIEGLPLRAALARTRAFWALALGWGLLAVAVALGAPSAVAHVGLGPLGFVAALVHEAQSLLGLDHPSGLPRALATHAPALAPLLLLLPLARWMPARPGSAAPASPRAAARFAIAWLVGFGLITGPVAAIWSAYFYTVPAVGAAVLVALAFRRASRAAWPLFVAALLWWHAGASAIRAFAIRDRLWGWTSRVTAAYLERTQRIATLLSSSLRTIDPAQPQGERLFFATLPSWSGVHMGNLVRALYRDPSLDAAFVSQFSDSTAGRASCRFYWWDGAGLRPLYRTIADPYFQVGADLLLLDRPAGAAHAFRRALAAAGERRDNLYWLGWAELWRGDRDVAEAAWKQFGAVDDTLKWSANMSAARFALITARDTLEGRRTLAEAIRYGIGRPEPHGVLGGLLLPHQPKYGMLELKVATFLNPDDWLSRRALLGALLDAHLEEPARRELEALMSRHPELGSDPVVLRARRELPAAGEPAIGVLELK